MSDDIVTRLRDRHATTWHSGALPSIFSAAADEIERLRAENAAWRDGVADAVEPLGFDREAASGPADLLPGLVTLIEQLAGEAEMRSEIENLRAQVAAWHTVATQLADTSHARRRQREATT